MLCCISCKEDKTIWHLLHRLAANLLRCWEAIVDDSGAASGDRSDDAGEGSRRSPSTAMLSDSVQEGAKPRLHKTHSAQLGRGRGAAGDGEVALVRGEKARKRRKRQEAMERQQGIRVPLRFLAASSVLTDPISPN